MTRREFVRMAAAAPLAAAAPALGPINSRIAGVMIGAQTYSFRDLPLEACINGMRDIGLGYAEFWIDKMQPADAAKLSAWRTNPPLDEVRAVRKRFEDAGIEIYAACINISGSFTDQQIEKSFEVAKALSTNKITSSSPIDIAERVDKFAQQYEIYFGFHNDRDTIRPNQICAPDDWRHALEGRSKYIAINLDIGHFTAANFDPVSFLEEHHSRILTLHIKDQKRNHGENVPWGQGDTDIRGALELLKARKYPIPAMIEYEYNKPGLDTTEEVRKCFEYCKAVLKG